MLINITYTVREKIKDTRRRKGWSRRILAEMCDVSSSYIAKIESHDSCNVNYGTLKVILQKLEIVEDDRGSSDVADDVIHHIINEEYDRARIKAKMFNDKVWVSVVDAIQAHNLAKECNKAHILREFLKPFVEVIPEKRIERYTKVELTILIMYMLYLTYEGHKQQAYELAKKFEYLFEVKSVPPRSKMASSANLVRVYSMFGDYDEALKWNLRLKEVATKEASLPDMQKYFARQIGLLKSIGKDSSEEKRLATIFLEMFNLAPNSELKKELD